MTGHGGHALERRLQPLAAAGDDEVHDARLGGELGQLVAAAAGHQRHRARRQAGGGGGVGGDGGEHRVGVRGRARAAQHDRVAGLQAQRGGVDGHVRAGLVDDRDHPERDAHAPQLQAVGQRRAVDDLAHGIGERGDLAHARRHPGDARLGSARAGPAARRTGRSPRRPPGRGRWPRGSARWLRAARRRSPPAPRP